MKNKTTGLCQDPNLNLGVPQILARILQIATTHHVKICLITGKIKQAEERQISKRKKKGGRAGP